jgi:hypothetical protein
MGQRGSAHLIALIVIFILIGLFLTGKVLFASRDVLKLPPVTEDSTRPKDEVIHKAEALSDGGVRYINTKESFQLDFPKNWRVDDDYVYWTSDGKDITYGDGISPINPEIIGLRMFANNFDHGAYFSTSNTKGQQTELYFEFNYQVKKGNSIYHFDFGSVAEQTLKDKKAEMDKIMSSLKWIDKAAPYQVTFTNPVLGYSFEYPSNWRVNTFQNDGNYNKGIIVINEQGGEVLTLEARELGNRCDTWYGGYSDFECKKPYAINKDGYEFKMNATYDNPEVAKMIQSFKGLNFIK